MNGGLGVVFRAPEFRVLWVTELLSICGDQLARVALAVLVYNRTGSAIWAAAVYALTFLPALFGGLLLGWVADRFRRREVMVTADLARAVLVAGMAVPGLPLGVLCALLSVTVLISAPFSAAQNALLPQVVPDEQYEPAIAVRQITHQAAQVIGFGAGGLLVATFDPYVALLLNAASFLLAALLVRAGIADRPRPGHEPHDPSGPVAAPVDEPARPPMDGTPTAEGAAVASSGSTPPTGMARDTAPAAGDPPAAPGRVASALSGVVLIWTDPRRRSLVALAWLIGWYVVPEGLAAPYAAEFGGGAAVVGLLMAADPIGSVLGAWLFVRFVPFDVRERWMGAIAVAAGLVLVFTLLRPGVLVTMLLWGLSGMFSTAYLLQTQASFVRSTPDSGRGRAIAVAASGIVAGQGVAVFIGGVFAEWWGAAPAVAAAGAIGAVASAAAAAAWHRARCVVRPADAERVSSAPG